MVKLSLSKDKIRILLLEGVHENAVREFHEAGYNNVELLPHALGEAELVEKIQGVHMLGIRSATKLTDKVLAAANRLFCVGCFCIGTNQVRLDTARRAGIPVFNAPYSNTRSVAELVIGEIVMLLRGIPDKSRLAHEGKWLKSAKDSFELRGKTLGIVGYGHIGSQLSVMAEAMGMRVRYFDTEKQLAIGNAQPCSKLKELLSISDVVTLHVPATPQTKNMIGEKELRAMRKGSYLINASRGNVVVIEALVKALEDKHLLGAAIDVFPSEPGSNADAFDSPLRGLSNVILTPHVAGSTHEAQANIGLEVAEKLIKYSDNGSTFGAVNFVEVSLPVKASGGRFLHIHANVPGMLRRINELFSSRNLNVSAQYLQTDPEVGYVVVDIDGEVDEAEVMAELQALEGTIRARYLY
ncbi:phosphoglycerate dehydrogenase [Telmatospirillum siberiense]|uniref:D-3-phosphoglycerate dehydrogenase n=1 Tax=Telmatospirillum siberiense TaxID=382514 RepID=A0A2N3Q1G6_9PROT|nr:phosphoglycerate dehydrogenase [Telmatospirillum siberiense]PKU26500.1 phosphoglycerate dehydrogenase [Telmatospirillum siberiense]